MNCKFARQIATARIRLSSSEWIGIVFVVLFSAISTISGSVAEKFRYRTNEMLNDTEPTLSISVEFVLRSDTGDLVQ